MKRLSAFLLAVVFVSSHAFGADAPLFKYKGKAYTKADLPANLKQSLFDIENENFMKLQQFSDNAMLEMYINEQAAAKKKTHEEIENSLFEAKEPNEKEMKEFYEKNKARLPYKYDEIKGELKQFIVVQKKQEKRQKLLDQLKKSGDAQFLASAPDAPVVQINSDGYPTKGKSDAKVVMVEFADYQCPHCKAAAPAVKKVVDSYKDKVKFVYIDFPINRSGVSRKVAEGGVCAAEQNKYWEYHALAFEKQPELSNDSPEKLAGELKLNVEDFKKCLAGTKPKEQVDRGMAEAHKVGVQGTPTIYINGKRLTSGYSEDQIKAALDKALKG